MSEGELRSILVAGVGNAWLRDDGFGSEVIRRLEQCELPQGVMVMDAGTGGLDLAYEVMRGYDALVILDVSRQGGAPGAVYLRVGRLRQVVPDTLDFYFEFVARGSICEGARLEQDLIEPWLRCRSCEHEWRVEIPHFRCPECASGEVEITSGNEFEVESI